MIIKNLYIEKFGGITDKKIEFDSKLNIIYAENESGKSTVAEFIKIMLYGIGKSPQNIRDNERTRFMPWGEKRMGGELTVSADNTDFTIVRTFGKRKSDDTVSVINSITGNKETELCIENPGEKLLGIGREGFEKSLYIKQLSSKIEAGKDDEILKKLVNLAQSGDEGVSFQRGMQILDSASKELNGTRPRGKMLILQDEINLLQTQRTLSEKKENIRKELLLKLNNLTLEKTKLEGFTADKSHINALKDKYSGLIADEARRNHLREEKIRSKELRIKSFFFQTIFSAVLLTVFAFVKPIVMIPFGLWTLFSLVLIVKTRKLVINDTDNILSDSVLKEIERAENEIALKEKENTKRLIETAQNISDIQNQLMNLEITSTAEIDKKSDELKNLHKQYTQNLSDIALAKKCLQEAFDEIQKSFGKRLNDETSLILNEITGGKYNEVLVNNDYNMLVRIAENNELQDARYLSNGTYDQIYFALRMGIIRMLFDKAPVILDEAFIQYDDNRLKLVLDYIKKAENRQILLFSCHKREHLIVNSGKVEF